MIFSDLPSLAEASNERTRSWTGFAQAGKPVATLGSSPRAGIMLEAGVSQTLWPGRAPFIYKM
jgi:hypothetical protein